MPYVFVNKGLWEQQQKNWTLFFFPDCCYLLGFVEEELVFDLETEWFNTVDIDLNHLVEIVSDFSAIWVLFVSFHTVFFGRKSLCVAPI